MKKLQFPLAILAVAALFVSAVAAATSVNFIITPASLAPGTGALNAVGVLMDSADGYAHGSIANNGGTAKSEVYFSLASAFGRPVTLGEIETISYATKKATDHVSVPADWFLAVYSEPFAGDVSTPTWYGGRYGAEPYFSQNLNEVAGDWNYWSTDAGDNRLRWFESTQGALGANFGSYLDPNWNDFLATNGLGTSVQRGSQKVSTISLQTGSAWTNGFTGQLDGLRVELTDGSVATFNFEPHLVPANRDSCKKNGWSTLLRPDASSFSNQGDCVSFVNTGR